MPRWVYFASACRLLVALTSFKVILDGNPTSWGKAVALLSQGALLLRTSLVLLFPTQSNRVCGWLAAVGLALNVVMVHGMASTVQDTLAGTTAASRQTQDFVTKAVQHCENGVSYITSSYLLIDQACGRLVLPEWAVLLLAELQCLALLRVHAASLPVGKLLVSAPALQLTVVFFPWLVRRFLYKHEQAPDVSVTLQTQQHPPETGSAALLADESSSHNTAAEQHQDSCWKGVAAAALLDKDSSATVHTTGSGGSPDTGLTTTMERSTSGHKAPSALHAAQLLVSNSCCQQGKSKPYVSVLGPTLQPMCIKIDTPALEPGDLSAETPQLLANALSGAFYRLGDEVILLGMSVRHGCILIAMQTFQPHIPMGVEACDAALKLAQQLLPGLLCHLRIAHDSSMLAQLMGPGTCMSLQRGCHLVQAVYEPIQGNWSMQDEPRAFKQWRSQNGQVHMPKLGLVLVKQVSSPLARLASGNAGTGSSRSSNAGGSSRNHATSHVMAVVEAMLCCSPAAVGHLTMGKAGAATDGRKAAHAAQEDAGDLQIYVMGEERYLPATLLQHVPAEDGTHVVAQVAVELQSSGLVQHHPGGPFAAVQPITLQLWCGKLLLDSSHVLLHLSPPAAASTSTVSGGSTAHSASSSDSMFGWWGTDAAVAIAAAAELHNEVQRACDQWMGSADVQQQHQAALQELVRDVCIWLAGVRQAACNGGWCACHATSQAQLGLPRAQMLLLADSLCHFAASRGLRAMHSMLQQQTRLILAQQHPPVSGTTTSHAAKQLAGLQQRLHTAIVRLRAAVAGHSCAVCEQLVARHMYGSLSQASICISMLTGIGGVVIIRRQSNRSQMLVAWGLACWGVLHLCASMIKFLVVHHGQAAHAASTPKAVPITARVASVAAFASKQVTMLSIVTGVGKRMDAMCKQHRAGTWVIMHLIHVVSDRLQLQGIVPQPIITMLACMEFIIMTLLNSQQHSWVEAMAGSAFAVLLCPLLLDMYARSNTILPGSHGLQYNQATQYVTKAGAECSFVVAGKAANTSMRARK